VLAIVLSIAVGLVGASIRVMRIPVLSQAVALYVEFIRNTPILVQLFFVFFGLPTLGITLSIFWSGVLALTLWAGAFQVENIRGGLAAISPGLREAARALGLSNAHYLRLIGLPLAVRVGLPAILNTCVSLVKNSAYLSAIGLQELTGVAFDRIATDFRAFEMLAVLLVGYLVVVLSLSASVRVLEHHLHAPFRR
jgi:His/Glu/Gln/Arg/opine family amino acid ABC transporter permease subunit